MATVNLGSIKFKWKGTYNGATAYTVDDVVEYNGSSYICILASTGNLPTNATYFEQMSQAGTNGTDGTDLTTTLTTQGDILYRNASGLVRLPAGTAGEALITNGTGANPSWGDVSGGLLSLNSVKVQTQQSLASASFTDLSGMSITVTPQSASSKFYVSWSIHSELLYNKGWKDRLIRNGSSVWEQTDQKNFYFASGNVGERWEGRQSTFYLDVPSTTSAVTYKIQVHQDGGGNVNYQNNGGISMMSVMEIGV